MQLLSSIDSAITFKEIEQCDVCHFAKQKRLPFYSSQNCTNSCFDLIHVHIWGPYHATSLQGFRFLSHYSR